MKKILFKRPFMTALALAACLQNPPVIATEFPPVDGAAEQVQSRRYDVDDPRLLLQACLAVLLDIRYQVTRSEVEPGLLVAQAPWDSCYCNRSLTISLHPDPERTGSFRVRLTAASPTTSVLFVELKQPDYTDFYQDFFSHLDRELFKEMQR